MAKLKKSKQKTKVKVPVPRAQRSPYDRLTDTDTIAKAENLGLHARKIVEGAMAGNYRSPFTGFAIEFAQHREYVQGDDLRHLDWKVYGRKERYYIKQYEQETNMDVRILLDASSSMQYTSHSMTKMEYGRMIAACFSYLVLKERNSLTVSLFDQQLRDYYPKTTSRGALNDICLTLVNFQPDSESNIARSLHDFTQTVKSKGVVLVISDFFDDPAACVDGIQHLAFGKQDVIVFHVLDPFELDFPFDGTVEFEGLEIPDKLTVQPWAIKKSYLQEFQKFTKAIREGCEKNDAQYVMCNTKQPLNEVIFQLLSSRLQRTGR